MKGSSWSILLCLLALSCRIHESRRQIQDPVVTPSDMPKDPDNPIQPTDSTVTPSAPGTATPAPTRAKATPMEGTFWVLPQNAAGFATLPTNQVRKVWSAGSALYTIHQGVGLGISKDKGSTWQVKTVGNGLGSTDVFDVYVQNSDVYVATGHGISISHDGGASWTLKFPGLIFTHIISAGPKLYFVGKTLQITTDGGTSWTESSVPEGMCVNRLLVRGTRLYAAQPCAFGTLWTSDDDGKNWQVLKGGALPDKVYDILFWKSLALAATETGLYVSNDGGVNWLPQPMTASVANLAVIHLESTDEKVYATVQDKKNSAIGALYSSKDGGASWTLERNAPLKFKGFGNTQVLFGDATGLHVSYDAGKSWGHIPAYGTRPEPVLTGVTVHDKSIYVLSTAGVSYSSNGGASWTNTTAESFFTGFYKSLYVTQGGWFVPASNKGLFISTDRGRTWTNKKDFVIPSDTVYLQSITGEGSRLLMASSAGLFVSEDLGSSWTLKTTRDKLLSNSLSNIKLSGKKLYLAAYEGFSISDDGGQVWQNFAPRAFGEFGGADVSEGDSALYFAISRYLGISRDKGQSWEVNPSPDLWSQVNTICCVEARGNMVFVGTNNGLYLSRDAGKSFEVHPLGYVRAIVSHGTSIYIGTSDTLFVYNPSISVR